MRYLYLLAFFFLCTVHSGAAQDYVVTLADQVEHGKVTFAPGNKVVFRAEGAPKAVTFLPLQIKGYYHKGVYYASKYSPNLEDNVFVPSFRDGDDPHIFKKVTKLEVLAAGKISFYRGTEIAGNPQMGGTVQAEVRVLDIRDNLSYIRDVSVNSLAEVVSDNQGLYRRVLEIKGKLKVEQIEKIVKEYNEWYVLKNDHDQGS